jgi:deferrochelatase/peroxidase EfeB
VSSDDPQLGQDLFANNYFSFDSDARRLKLKGHADDFPRSLADPLGATCPLAAHIRKVNTRDSSSDMGARSSTYERRILRVGVPFGDPLPTEKRYVDDHRKRGLLFLSIQASIEEQFEFLQARWINDESRPKMPGGNDMIVGQNAATSDGIRRCSIFGNGFQIAEVIAPKQWVVPTGGGYFFVPSVSAVREVLAA